MQNRRLWIAVSISRKLGRFVQNSGPNWNYFSTSRDCGLNLAKLGVSLEKVVALTGIWSS